MVGLESILGTSAQRLTQRSRQPCMLTFTHRANLESSLNLTGFFLFFFWGKPTQTWSEHAKSTQKSLDSVPGPSCCGWGPRHYSAGPRYYRTDGLNVHNYSRILKGLSSPYNKQMKARHFTFGKRTKCHYYLKHVFLGFLAIWRLSDSLFVFVKCTPPLFV